MEQISFYSMVDCRDQKTIFRVSIIILSRLLHGFMKRFLPLIALGLFLAETVFAQAPQPSDEIQIPQLQPKKWAICIGVSNYESLGKLRFGAKDCISFANTLKTELGFTQDSVSVLADQEGLVNANAETVNRALDSMLSRTTLDSGDLFIVYFSGHGMGLSDGDYWMPNDATVANAHEKGISVQKILERLAKKKLRNVVVVSDACRAGGQNPFGRKLIDLGKKTNIGVLLGCAPGMKSYEAPNLGQGTFTYFLNRAIQKKSAVDPSIGAMLLSKLGDSVAKSVEDYTRHDYGDNAQKPSIYAEKEQEVVLGTFAPKKEELTLFLNSYKQKLGIGAFTPLQYKDALADQVAVLCQSKRSDEALSILRVLQSYGTLEPYALYAYAKICRNRGASYELNLVLQKNNLDFPDSIYDDMAVIYGQVNAVGQARYLSAIWNLYDSEVRDTMLPAMDGLIQHLSEPDKNQLLFANRLLHDYPADGLVIAFAALLKKSIDPTKPEIEAAFKQVQMLDRESKFVDAASRIMYRTYLRRNQYDLAKAVVEGAKVRMPDSGYWEMRSLIIATLIHDPALVDRARSLLASSTNGDSIYSLLTVLRASSIDLEPEFRAAAQRLPNELNVQVANWVVKTAKNLKDFQPVPDSLVKMAQGHLSVSKLAYGGLDTLLSFFSNSDKLSAYQVISARRKMANDLAQDLTEIDNDPELVVLLSKLINNSDESYRLAFLSQVGPWQKIEERLITNKADYLKELYICQLNNGFNGLADETLAKLEKLEGVDSGVLVRSGLDSLLHGDIAHAAILIDRLKKINPIGIDASFLTLLTTHLAFLKGDLKAIGRMTKDLKESFSVDGGALLYIRYLQYVGQSGALPSEELLKMLIEPWPNYHDLWSIALVKVTSRCRQLKGSREKMVAEELPYWVVSESLNGNFEEFGYNDKANIAEYVGRYELSGYFSLSNDTVDGSMSFEIDKDGNFKGTLDFPTEKQKIKLTGKVNGFGRVAVDLDIGGKKVDGAFAIVPFKVYTAADDRTLPSLQLVIGSNTAYRFGFSVTGKKKSAPQ